MALVSLSELVAAAQAGSLISFPTDTVPALAALPCQSASIFGAKVRSTAKPLILMAATPEDLWPYVQGTLAERRIWHQMADRYWPGALTLVLPSHDPIATWLNPQDPTSLGLRVPDHEMAQRILGQTGPLGTTSANRSGEPALEDLETIATVFPQVQVLAPSEILPSSPASLASGQPSTVIRWSGKTWEVLRQGAVSLPYISPPEG